MFCRGYMELNYRKHACCIYQSFQLDISHIIIIHSSFFLTYVHHLVRLASNKLTQFFGEITCEIWKEVYARRVQDDVWTNCNWICLIQWNNLTWRTYLTQIFRCRIWKPYRFHSVITAIIHCHNYRFSKTIASWKTSYKLRVWLSTDSHCNKIIQIIMYTTPSHADIHYKQAFQFLDSFHSVRTIERAN